METNFRHFTPFKDFEAYPAAHPLYLSLTTASLFYFTVDIE